MTPVICPSEIKERFEQHYLHDMTRVELIDFAEADWDHGPGRSAGWSLPLPRLTAPGVLSKEDFVRLEFCSVRLARLTNVLLPPENRKVYLGVVQNMIDLHITMIVGDEVFDQGERERAIDSIVYDSEPGLLAFMSEAELIAGQLFADER